MYQITGKLQGTADLLFNRMTPKELLALQGGTGGGKIPDSVWREDAIQKCPVDENGKAHIPSWMFKQVVAAGARAGNLKEGRKNIAPYLIATVFVEGLIYITPATPDYIKEIPSQREIPFDYMHEHPGKRPPKTGGACMIYRPAFKTGWTASFTLNVLDPRRSPEQVRIALEEAGILVGIGSWRPEHGRFIVTDWSHTKG
jgi:hypothetical protein